jgi:hypothetical protein
MEFWLYFWQLSSCALGMQVTIEQAAKEAWTSPKQRVWLRLIVWPRESWLHARRFVICQLGATNP